MSPGPNLRQQRRDETRRLLHEAAVELSLEVGFENVTAESVSNRVGVSPRTFFNYFPSKEAAVVSNPPVRLDPERTAEFGRGEPAEPSVLLTELTHLLLDQLEDVTPRRADAEVLFRIASQHPSVFATMVGQLEAVRLELADAVGRRLGPRSDRQTAGLVAAVAMTAVRSGLEEWALSAGADPQDSPVPFVRRAVDLLATMSSSPASGRDRPSGTLRTTQ